MIWIVTANSNTCRIYNYAKSPQEMSLIKEINHPENKLKKSELLTSEKPGHYQTDTSARGTYSPRTDPKDVEIDNFSREIANELNQGRNANAYTNLIIITSAHMNGLLSHHLDKNVAALVKKEIQKDVMQLPNHELIEFLKDHLKPC